GTGRSDSLLGARIGARSRQRDRSHQPRLRAPGVLMAQPIDGPGDFLALTRKISRERGFGCASYKEKCLQRRIAVRMRARGAQTSNDSARILNTDPGEYDRLLDALTINVTKLFRNWEAYAALAAKVIPELWHRESAAIRVWSAGCSSGDEPYSL